jgi:hypothetical protein
MRSRQCRGMLWSLLVLPAIGLALAAQPPQGGQGKEPAGLAKSKLRPREGTLKVGDLVPALKVKDLQGKKEVALRELKGKPVVLIFGSCT